MTSTVVLRAVQCTSLSLGIKDMAASFLLVIYNVFALYKFEELGITQLPALHMLKVKTNTELFKHHLKICATVICTIICTTGSHICIAVQCGESLFLTVP